MKNILSSILILLNFFVLTAQEKMYIHKKDNSVLNILITDLDSIKISDDNSKINLLKDGIVSEYLISEIDSITFGADIPLTDTVKINLTNNTFDNPYAYYGISIYEENNNIIVNSVITDKELSYVVTGNKSNGGIKFYSDYKFNLILDGVDIYNANGPAINIQSGKKITVTLKDGTINKLSDGNNYILHETEDMKSTFFSEGQLNFEGNGTLFLEGNYKHAICSDDYIRVKSGNIIVSKTIKDAIHCNDYFRMDGGSINLTSESDGIECEEGYILINDGNIYINSGDDAISASYKKTDVSITPYIIVNGGEIDIITRNEKGAGLKSKISDITINKGTINIKVSGIASKAISSGKDITINDGTLNLITEGNAYYDTDESDTSSAAGIKCDGNLIIKDGAITINSSGSGGKGINVDGTLTIDGGNIQVTTSGEQYVYDKNNDTAAKAIKSDGKLTINNGSIIIKTYKTEAEGLESKDSLIINGGIVEIEAYDDGINSANNIQINGGIVYSNSTTNDAIDSNGTIIITGGTVLAFGSAQPEAGFDCDNNTFKITGGLLIGTGGSTSTPTSNVCTQRSVIYGAGSVSSGQCIQIKSTTGDLLLFEIPKSYNSMTMLFSSPDLSSGITYTINKGGSISGGTNFHGLYSNATYSGGSTHYTFNASNMVTSVGSTTGGPGGGGRP